MLYSTPIDRPKDHEFALLLDSSKHHHTDPATPILIDCILRINTPGYWRCSVIVKVEMQLAVSRGELQVFEEQRIVQKS